MRLRVFIFTEFNNHKCKNCFYNTICAKSRCVNYKMTGDMHKVDKSESDLSKKIFETVVRCAFLNSNSE